MSFWDCFKPWEMEVEEKSVVHASKYPIGMKVNYLGKQLTVVKNRRVWAGPKMPYHAPCLVLAGYDNNGRYEEIDAVIDAVEAENE